MSYSNPKIVTYQSPVEKDLGDGAVVTAWSFKGPDATKKGKLIDIGIHCTETFACDSTPASISVGTAADADAYGKLNIPDATAITDTYNSQSDTDAVISSAIPAGAQVEVLPAVGVDASTEAGKGYEFVTVEWY
jgi:hypothetical protein